MNLHIQEDGEAKCAAFVELQSPSCLEPPPEMIFDDSIFILVILTQLLKILLNLTCPSIFSLKLSLLINSSEMLHEAYKKKKGRFFSPSSKGFCSYFYHFTKYIIIFQRLNLLSVNSMKIVSKVWHNCMLCYL